MWGVAWARDSLSFALSDLILPFLSYLMLLNPIIPHDWDLIFPSYSKRKKEKKKEVALWQVEDKGMNLETQLHLCVHWG